MARHVGFVRNVMIGREGLHRVVLLDAVAQAGGADAVSYISTGNVTFDLDPDRLYAFQSELEERIAAVIGRHEPVFTRTFDHIADMYHRNPFTETPFPDAVERIVSFCPEPLEGTLDLPYVTDRGDIAVFAVDGADLFTVNREVGGRRRGPGGVIERLIGVRITSRAWSTIERIVAKQGR